MGSKYPKFEPQGDMLWQWMKSTDEPQCPIEKSTLNLIDLSLSKEWFIKSEPQSLPHYWYGWASRVGFPIEGPNGLQRPFYKLHSIMSRGNGKEKATKWFGRTGPGVIFIDCFSRAKGCAHPYMSEFTKGIYEINFDINSLKYVVFTTIIEADTSAFVNDDLYKSRGLFSPLEEPQTWESPSAEFCGILGTPIGKVAGAIVLCAFGQGIKQISRVVTFHIGLSLHIQFEIGDV